AGGDASLVMMARVAPSAAGATLVDTASVSAADQPDSLAANDSASVAITVQSADLALAMSVNNSTPDENSTITYSLTLSNGGPHQATAIRVTDLLPAGLTLEQALSSQGSYDSGSGVWSISDLSPGSLASLRLIAKVEV